MKSLIALFRLTVSGLVVMLSLHTSADTSLGQQPAAINTVFCDDYHANVIYGTDPANGKCYIDVTICIEWSPQSSSTNALDFPYGFEVSLPSGTIASIGAKTGTWIPSASQDPVNPSGLSTVRFYRVPLSNGSSTPWIPYKPQNISSKIAIPTCVNNSLPNTVRIYIQPTGTTIPVHINFLTGNFVLSSPNYVFSNAYDCPRDTVITLPACSYTLSADPADLCGMGHSTINIVGTLPSGSTVTWYKCSPSPAVCPMFDPLNLGCYTLVGTQTGGSPLNTNDLTQSSCYVAVIQGGCSSCITPPVKVSVCPAICSGLSIVTNPSLNNLGQICSTFTGTLKLNGIDINLCNALVEWQKQTGASWTIISGGTVVSGVPTLNVGPLNCPLPPTSSTLLTPCFNTYAYRTILTYTCGGIAQKCTTYVSIEVDRPLTKFDIALTVSPMGILCHHTPAILNATVNCGKIDHWAQSTDLGATWSNLPGAGSSSSYWTNPLDQETWYKVYGVNRSCTTPVPSDPIKIKVKPLLGINVTATKTCWGPTTYPILTVTTSPLYPPPLTYQWWYSEPSPHIVGTNSATLTTNPTSFGPGWYWVVVTDLQCDVTETSTPLYICPSDVAIDGPSCVCATDPPFTLTAIPIGDCGTGCQFRWSKNGGPFGAWSSSPALINQPLPGVGQTDDYIVEMKCGTFPNQCTSQSKKHYVKRCN